MTFKKFITTLLWVSFLLMGGINRLILAEETTSGGASGSAAAPGHAGSSSGAAISNGAKSVEPSATPAAKAPINPTLGKLAVLPATVNEADLLAKLSQDELSKLTPEEISKQSEPLKTKLTQLSSALKKTPEELAKFWKDNKTRMGDTAEGRAMRAVLDQRMKDFPGLEEIHQKTGGAREELYQKVSQLKAQLNDPSIMKDPTQRNAAITELSQMVSSTQFEQRSKLQQEIAAKLADPKIPEQEKRLLQGVDLALKMERGSVLDSTSGLRKVEGKVMEALQGHPLLEGMEGEVKAKVLGEFETSRNEEQIRIKNYWDAIATMKSPDGKSAAEVKAATDLLQGYGETTSWNARQYALTDGNAAYSDALVASAKVSGILDNDKQLHSMTTSQIAGANPIGGLNGLRDDGLVHQIINTADPAVLNAYLKSRGEQNDGGAYHTEEAKQALRDHEALRNIVADESKTNESKKTLLAEEGDRIARERAARSLDLRALPSPGSEPDLDASIADAVKIEKEKIEKQTKQAEVDVNGALQWRPYDYQVPSNPPIPPMGPAVAVVPNGGATPKSEAELKKMAPLKNLDNKYKLDGTGIKLGGQRGTSNQVALPTKPIIDQSFEYIHSVIKPIIEKPYEDNDFAIKPIIENSSED